MRVSSLRPSGWAAVVFIVLTGLIVTLGTAGWLAREEDREAHAIFDGAADTFFSNAQARLRSATQLTHSLAGLKRMVGQLDRRMLESYITETDMRLQYPGFSALGYIERLNAPGRPAFLARMRKAGHADYPLPPEDGSGTQWPVTYIDPLDAARRVEPGFDMGADPVMRSVLDAARDSGDVAGTSRVEGVFGVPPGFVLVHPLYANGALPVDLVSRRRLIAGFIFVLFNADDLMRDPARQLPSGVAGRLLADLATRDHERELYNSIPDLQRSVTADTRQELESVGGELLMLEAAPTAHFIRETDHDRSQLVLALGSLTTLLMGLIVWLFATRSAWAERRASQMAASLTASEKRYAIAMETTTDGIWELDLETRKTRVSPRFEALLGYPPGSFEAAGTDPGSLVHPTDRFRVKTVTLAHVTQNTPYVLEFRMRGADGHYIWVRSHGRAQRGADGRAASILGSITNVSDLHAALDRSRDLSQMASDWFWEQDANYCFTSFSESSGFHSEIKTASLGKTRWDIANQNNSPEMAAHRATVEAHQPFRDFEYPICDPQGECYWYSVNGKPLFDDGGRFVGYRGTARDITERKRMEAELRTHRDNLSALVDAQTANLLRAKDAAEKASHAKSEFLANMSHELRTPMHAILSFARIGHDKATFSPPEKLREYFARIQTSGERLLELINDLLDLSKLEAGKMPLEQDQINLAQLAREVAHDLEAIIEAHRLTLEFPAPACDTTLHGNATRLAQVIRNLLSNAIKFTPPGKRIVVAFAAAELPKGRRAQDHGMLAALCMSVSDEGIGIPDSELEIVFDKFYQSTKTRNGAGGTGLGLAICREIVTAHRGTIQARNRSAEGTTFDVVLPRGPL